MPHAHYAFLAPRDRRAAGPCAQSTRSDWDIQDPIQYQSSCCLGGDALLATATKSLPDQQVRCKVAQDRANEGRECPLNHHERRRLKREEPRKVRPLAKRTTKSTASGALKLRRGHEASDRVQPAFAGAFSSDLGQRLLLRRRLLPLDLLRVTIHASYFMEDG